MSRAVRLAAFASLCVLSAHLLIGMWWGAGAWFWLVNGLFVAGGVLAWIVAEKMHR